METIKRTIVTTTATISINGKENEPPIIVTVYGDYKSMTSLRYRIRTYIREHESQYSAIWQAATFGNYLIKNYTTKFVTYVMDLSDFIKYGREVPTDETTKENK